MKAIFLSILFLGSISCAHTNKQSSNNQLTNRSVAASKAEGDKVKNVIGILCDSAGIARNAQESLSSLLASQSFEFRQETNDGAGPLWVKGKDIQTVSAITIIKGETKGLRACVTYRASKARYISK